MEARDFKNFKTIHSIGDHALLVQRKVPLDVIS